jgi:DNA-binding SARP family transcriptional activator
LPRGVSIRLLGSPEIRDTSGEVRPLRGHQAWALLARIVLSDGPISRQELASQLFPETVDPLGSLRWCLAALRKAMNSPDVLTGDPLEANLPPGTAVDVLAVGAQDLEPETTGSLLAGIEPRCSPEFSTWLMIERERIAALIDARLRQQVLSALSVRDYGRALRLAELAVRRNSLDESAHILLTRSLMLAGRRQAALAHVEATEALFTKELGEKPSGALRSAARLTASSPPAGVTAHSVARSLLESGLAAVAAGAGSRLRHRLRRAVTSAEEAGDEHLHAKCLLELGTALVHAVRGYDDEGAILLRQSIGLAETCSDSTLAAAGYCELGYVEALAGRRPAASGYLESGLPLCENLSTRAAIHSVMGFNLVDWGKAEEGLGHFECALDLARRAQNPRREIWALGIGAWGQLSAGRPEVARQWLRDCLSLLDDLRWIAFRPWPLALLAETELKTGRDADDVRPLIEEAFTLGCQIADPCWEGMAARVMAQAEVSSGNFTGALSWLSEANKRCLRETDTYKALQVEILGDRTTLYQKLNRPDQAADSAREWLSLAARTHMSGHLERARLFLQSLA